MSAEAFALVFLALVATGLAIFYQKKQQRRATDDELSEWEEFLIKGNRDKPEKKPIVTTSELPAAAYDTIEKMWNPKLKREFNERFLALKNEISARAIQLERVTRRMAEGKPLSDFDDAILIREKLRNGDSREPIAGEPFEMEFTPGRKFEGERQDEHLEDKI